MIWAVDTSTRKSMSAGNRRYGQHLLRSWSKDQTVIAMSSRREWRRTRPWEQRAWLERSECVSTPWSCKCPPLEVGTCESETFGLELPMAAPSCSRESKSFSRKWCRKTKCQISGPRRSSGKQLIDTLKQQLMYVRFDLWSSRRWRRGIGRKYNTT